MVATISSRSGEAKRPPGRRPGEHAGQRIRKLTILPDIVEWIRSGFPSSEVARRIHANGFLEEVPYDRLREEVARYAKVALSPEEVLQPSQMSAVQVHAANALESAVGELLELGDIYRIEKAMLCQATGMTAGPGTIGAGEELPAQVALPTPKDGLEGEPVAPVALQAGQVRPGVQPKTFRDVRELLAEMRQTLRIHGGLRERLGGLERGPEEQTATREERLAGVVKGRFAGRADVQEALLDPRRRTKILGVLHRFLTSERSQDAAAQALAGELVSDPDR